MIGAVLIFIAPIIHFNFPKKNAEIVSFEKKLNNKILYFKEEITTLKQKYRDNVISAENYIIQLNEIEASILKQEQINQALLENKENDSRVLGWLTIRAFLIGFGIRLPYLFFSLLISYLIFKVNTEDKNLKLTFLFLQIACYTITLYELVWVFWHSQDYPLSAYKWIALYLSAFAATTVVYFISYRELLRMRLQKIVNALSRFIVIDARKHIKPEEEKEYVNGYIKAIEKSMK